MIKKVLFIHLTLFSFVNLPLSALASDPAPDPETLTVAMDAKILDGLPATGNSATLKPPFANVIESLTAFGTGSHPVAGGLATKWEVSQDLKTYTFHLRSGVAWHKSMDGFAPTRLLDADDVVDTFDRFGNPAHPLHNTPMTHGGAFSYYQFDQMADLLDRVEAVDAHTVRFTLKQPSALFPEIIAQLPFAIGSREYADWCVSQWNQQKKAAEQAGRPLPWQDDPSLNPLSWYDSHPVGTGPYRVAARDPQKGTILLEATATAKRGAFKHVLFKPFPDLGDRTQAVAKAEADIAISPDPLQALALRKKGIPVQAVETKNASFLTFHHSFPVELRGAISMALNRKKYLDEVYGGNGRVLGSMVDKSLLPEDYLVPEVFQFNPHKAAAALNSFIGTGRGERALTLVYPPAARPYNPDPKKYAQLIAQDLKAVGFEVRLATVGYKKSDPQKNALLIFDDPPDPDLIPDLGSFSTRVSAGSQPGEAILYGDSNTTQSGYDRLLNSTASGLAKHPGDSATNYSGWSDAEYDGLVKKIYQEPDAAQRALLCARAERIMFERGLPYIPMTNSKMMNVVSRRVAGYEMSDLNQMFLGSVSPKSCEGCDGLKQCFESKFMNPGI